MTQNHRRAIIDIGSNTIRLVVFGGSPRAPVVLYNEKLMAGLGRGVIAHGRLADDAMAHALQGLARFKALIDGMPLDFIDVVATAAVRDASNGLLFLERIKALGLGVRLLSGEEEALASGFGAISANPDADGIVADLGGGSLELVRVSGGSVQERVSLPVGILSVQGLRDAGDTSLDSHIRRVVGAVGWIDACRDLPLYLVGGSWRSLARVHMHLHAHPLQILANYSFPAAHVAPLSAAISAMTRDDLRKIPSLPNGRVALVLDAAALLSALVQVIAPSQLVTCAFGLREGLLFQALSPVERGLDPLLEGVRFATDAQQQFLGYDEALMQWMDGLFGHEASYLRRLRHAACVLRGTGWASNPDFRALSGEELALHGNWAGVDARDRAIMGQALFTGLGGGAVAPAILCALADEADLNIGRNWGHAIRVAQRLSGGAPVILAASRVSMVGNQLVLTLPAQFSGSPDPVLSRRLDRLATSMGSQEARIVAANRLSGIAA